MSTPFCVLDVRRLPNSSMYRITRRYSQLKKDIDVYCVTDSLVDAEATEIGRRIGNALAAEIQRRERKPKKKPWGSAQVRTRQTARSVGTPTGRGVLRCGRDHAKVVFKPFKKESPTEFQRWALCPVTKEPMMSASVLKGDPRGEVLAAHGHKAECEEMTTYVLTRGTLKELPGDLGEMVSQIPRTKLRCPKCRRGPVIVKTYAKEEVQYHCADCGHTWQPRKTAKACDYDFCRAASVVWESEKKK